jgi:hypothetical protein
VDRNCLGDCGGWHTQLAANSIRQINSILNGLDSCH